MPRYEFLCQECKRLFSKTLRQQRRGTAVVRVLLHHAEKERVRNHSFRPFSKERTCRGELTARRKRRTLLPILQANV